MVSDGTEFAVGDIERLFEEARRNTETKHEKWKKYYNRRRRDVQIKVRIYRHRKCDETEIGTGSSDNGSLHDEASGFDRVQRRSNDSRDGKKKGSIPSSWSEKDRMIKKGKNQKLGYKRANESRSGGPERKVRKGSEHRVPKRNLSSNDTNSVFPNIRKKSRREETVAPTTSGYNLRPRIGKREESRPTIQRKTQQGGPVRSRKGRERNDSPYIEERTRSSNKNARRGGDQQRQKPGKERNVFKEIFVTGGLADAGYFMGVRNVRSDPSPRRGESYRRWYKHIKFHDLKYLEPFKVQHKIQMPPLRFAVPGMGPVCPALEPPLSLSQIIDPSEGLVGVYFHVDISIQVSKQKELPCYLKQLALERITNAPKDAVHMYTNGSKLGSDCSGSGIYISFRDQEIKIRRKIRTLARYFVSSLLQFLRD
ncbi:uncharacterized protein TNCV_4978001 [Trichonephila clavipes]|nr:uncharacterized protein TNCV_4978001 [Trichonephila clavipes]